MFLELESGSAVSYKLGRCLRNVAAAAYMRTCEGTHDQDAPHLLRTGTKTRAHTAAEMMWMESAAVSGKGAHQRAHNVEGTRKGYGGERVGETSSTVYFY